MKMCKDTRTHEISFECDDNETLVNRKDLIEKVTAMAMTIKPNETRTVSTRTIKVILRAKKNYSAKSFLDEHQAFFDAIMMGTKEN